MNQQTKLEIVANLQKKPFRPLRYPQLQMKYQNILNKDKHHQVSLFHSAMIVYNACIHVHVIIAITTYVVYTYNSYIVH